MNVEYMTHSGDDLLIVNAARVSFSKESDWEYKYPKDELFNYKKLSDRDRKLLNFLAREKHLLPFRHPQITLRCKAPLFLARQLG